MKRQARVILALYALCLAVVSYAAPPLRVLKPRMADVFLPGEKTLLQRSSMIAKPLDLTKFANVIKPPRVDYGNLVTYIRCQDYGGGCMTYAGLYAADIINEFQAPYSPDLSWQYILRTWDEQVNDLILTQGITIVPDMLDSNFRVGVSSEGLCRSESDYLTTVPPNDPKLKPLKGDRMYFDPAPSAEAKEEAEQYKFHVSTPITPAVDTLKTLLLTHGPVWADGGWWWNGDHAMCFVGYDDTTQQFRGVNSGGDWSDDHGFWTIPYDKLTSYVRSLRTVDMMLTDRYQGRWAFTSRFRIRGTWRGTWTVNIGVQGQVPQTVYRSYGRVATLPYCYGEQLDLDVPLPAYAAQFWPPRANAKWYLQVEDNDRDGQTGQVTEWILARRYQDPNCGSVDQWKTETYKYSTTVSVPDATGDPVVTTPPAPGNPAPPQRNTKTGQATLLLPEAQPGNRPIRPSEILLKPGIAFDPEQCTMGITGDCVLVGKLAAIATGQGLRNKPVDLCQYTASDNVNKPSVWRRLARVNTDAQGRFEFHVKLPALANQTLGAAFRGPDGVAVCSTKPLVRSGADAKWHVEQAPLKVLTPDWGRPPDFRRPEPQMP